MGERIVLIEAWLCPLPLPRELRLGSIRYSTRDYVVLRITTESGITGCAIGYTRDTPLLDAVRMLAPHVRHADVSLVGQLRRQFAPGWGSLVRAASLYDIALWDIAARERALPVEALLGTEERDVPLMAVAGYFLDQRGPGEIVDEVRQFVDEGYSTIKLIVPGHEIEDDIDLVARVSEVLPAEVGLAIDFHGAFTDVPLAIDYCRAFERFDMVFIEDPFSSYDVGSVTAVARGIRTPVAAGEDVSTASTYGQLLDGGVGYLRLDATASGGYTAALSGLAAVETSGTIAAPHVWPHIHHPLASRSQFVGMVELIPHYSTADPVDLILREPFPLVDGHWRPPAHEGLYLPLDWERVAELSTASWAGT